MYRKIVFITFLLLIIPCPSVFSHYLWATIEKDSENQETTNLYFEDRPKPGPGEYLQPFVDRAKTWIRTLQTDHPEPIELEEIKKEGDKWLSGKISQLGPRSVETYAKWGAYRFPKVEYNTLLHYFAKHLDVNSLDSLEVLGKSPDFLLDLVPSRYVRPSQFFGINLGIERLSNFVNRWIGPSIEILVLWKGQPAAKTKVTIRSPTGPKVSYQTNKNGYLRFQAPSSGLFTFKAFIEERDKKGVEQGKDYDVVRYTSTLTMKLPMEFLETEE